MLEIQASPSESCEKIVFDDEDDDKNKMSELKRPDLKGIFRCNICSKIFCHSSSLSRHRMQAHFKTYKCTICGKDISSSETLRTHMFTHHQVSRMFMCRCCNWAFPDKSLLHAHLQSTSIDAIRHSVINRRCVIANNNNNNNTTPLDVLLMMTSPATQQTPDWLAQLPKPIPTMTPVFLDEIKKEDIESPDGGKEEAFSRNSSQSPTGSSSSGSFKSDSQLSAFHQLNTDRTLLVSPVDSSPSSSRVSPRNDCYDCQLAKSKLVMSENKCKYLESRANTLQNEAVEAHSQLAILENTIHRMKMESKMLIEHNELFQRKLLNCQSLAVRFLQSNKMADPREVQAFLNHLVNSTILTSVSTEP